MGKEQPRRSRVPEKTSNSRGVMSTKLSRLTRTISTSGRRRKSRSRWRAVATPPKPPPRIRMRFFDAEASMGFPHHRPNEPVTSDAHSREPTTSEVRGLRLRASVDGLLAPDQFPLLGHGALHQEHEEHEPQAQDGEQPEDVEVGQGRRLLLAEVARATGGSSAATAAGSPVCCRK